MIEIACFSVKDAVIAQKGGADRIEFCINYKEGGISPSDKLIREARDKISVPLFIMIRPRPGNFIYSKKELKEMKEKIRFCRKMKCNGVVFGILKKNRKLDKKACKELVKLAGPMSCTFHRAFDKTENILHSLEDCIDCGFETILSSGGAETAMQGELILKHLVKQAKKRITVMPGGSVRSDDIPELRHVTKAKEYHSSAINKRTGKINEQEIRRLKKLTNAGIKKK